VSGHASNNQPTGGSFSGTNIILDFAVGTFAASDLDVKVAYTVGTGTVDDNNGNSLAVFTATTSGVIDNTLDVTVPTVTITPSPSSPSDSDSNTITFQWSEPVTGFDASDVALSDGTKGTFIPVDGDTYTLVWDLTGLSDATHTITVAQDGATDNNGNTGPASATVENFVRDITNPTLVSVVTTTASTIDITYNEDINGASVVAADYTSDTTDFSTLGIVGVSGSVVTLTYNTPFGTGVTPTIAQVGGVDDTAGNTLTSFN